MRSAILSYQAGRYDFIWSAFAVLALLLFWQWGSYVLGAASVFARGAFSPYEVSIQLVEYFTSGRAFASIPVSIGNVVPWLVAGSLFGYFTGAFVAVMVPSINAFFKVFTYFTLSFSKFAVFFILFVYFALGRYPIMMLSLWIGFVFVFANSFLTTSQWLDDDYNADGSIRDELLSARNLGASRWDMLTQHVLWKLLPSTLVTFQITTTLCWTILTFSEEVVNPKGVGYDVVSASRSLNTSGIFARAIVLAMCSSITCLIAQGFFWLIMPWNRKS